MISVVLFTLIGTGVLSVLALKKSLPELFALGFLVGFLFCTLNLFILIFLHIPMTIFTVIPLITTEVLVSLFLIISRQKDLRWKFRIRELNYALWGIILIVLLSVVVNTARPIFQWDAITLYEFRARIFASGKLLTNSMILNNILDFQYFYGYPPLLSIAHAFEYIAVRGNALYLYNAFYASILIVFYSSLRRFRISKEVAAGTTLTLAITPFIFEYATSAYTNLPYMVYLFVSILTAIEFVRFRSTKDIVLVYIAALGSICIRQTEPFFILPFIIMIVGFSVKNKMPYLLLFIGLILSLFVVRWGWGHYFTWDFRSLTPLEQSKLLVTSAKTVPEDLPPPSLSAVIEFLVSALHQYYLYFFVLIATIIIKFRTIFIFKYHILALFVSIALLIAGTFYLALHFSAWNGIPDSVSRMMMFLVPLILHYAALSFSNTIENG